MFLLILEFIIDRVATQILLQSIIGTIQNTTIIELFGLSENAKLTKYKQTLRFATGPEFHVLV